MEITFKLHKQCFILIATALTLLSFPFISTVVYSWIGNISSVIKVVSYAICTPYFDLQLSKFLYWCPIIFLIYIFGTCSLILNSLVPSFFSFSSLIASLTPSICLVVPDIFSSILSSVPKMAFSDWKSQNILAPMMIRSFRFFLTFCKSSIPISNISSYIGSSSNLIFSFMKLVSLLLA